MIGERQSQHDSSLVEAFEECKKRTRDLKTVLFLASWVIGEALIARGTRTKCDLFLRQTSNSQSSIFPHSLENTRAYISHLQSASSQLQIVVTNPFIISTFRFHRKNEATELQTSNKKKMSSQSSLGSLSSLMSAVRSVSRVISNTEVASETPFLDQTDPSGPIAAFLHDELTLGKMLDSGRFTENFEIVRINRDLRFKTSTVAEEKARLELWNSASTKGRPNYSVKGVRSSLREEREIERAVLGLTIEANYLARLDHPNIIKLCGLSSATVMLDDDCYEYHAIVFNRITETLAERIDHWNEQDQLSLQSDFILHLKTDYAFQIADAVSYLHDRRIIFRNLTLDNIGFTINDAVQLMNFDCVKEIPEGESYLEDGFQCSQTYMSLEMYQGDKYDFKVDSFAWAICFYEMLTQEPAFQTTTNEEALIREHGWCPGLEGCDYVPDGLLDLLEDAWEPNPEERVSMKEVKKQLEWILFGNDDQSEEEDSRCTEATRRSSIDILGYGLFLGDESCLGLDIDEESSRRRSSDVELHAAVLFSGTSRSFIPSGLLLDAEEAPQITPAEAATAMEHLIPKLEYTRQYKGIRKDKMPPLSMASNTNKARRRCSNQHNLIAGVAMCA